MTVEADLREQLVDAFEDADYPVSDPMTLIPALPDGPSTRFETGEFSMTAMELYTKTDGGDFPYQGVDPLVDDLIDALRERGEL